MIRNQDTAPRSGALDHELIRLEAAANPGRTYSEHVEAAIAIAGRTYVEDLRRIQRIQDEEMGL